MYGKLAKTNLNLSSLSDLLSWKKENRKKKKERLHKVALNGISKNELSGKIRA